MKKLLLLYLAYLFFPALFAADKKTEMRLQQIETSVIELRMGQKSLDGEQQILQERTKSIGNMVEASNGFIANEIASSERLMGILSVVIALIAVLLGIYVTVLHGRILKISDTVKSLSNEIEGKKMQIMELANDINNNFDSLFKKIRRADTKEYVKRLEIVPLDVMNLSEILLARELEDEDYDVLKRAYENLKKMGKESAHPQSFQTTYGDVYRLLFFQHFAGQAIADNSLRDQILNDLVHIVRCCFENDIKKSLSDLAPELKKKSVPYDRLTVLKKFLSALDQSEFKGNAEIYAILENGIADPDLWTAANTPELPNLNSDIQPKDVK